MRCVLKTYLLPHSNCGKSTAFVFGLSSGPKDHHNSGASLVVSLCLCHLDVYRMTHSQKEEQQHVLGKQRHPCSDHAPMQGRASTVRSVFWADMVSRLLGICGPTREVQGHQSNARGRSLITAQSKGCHRCARKKQKLGKEEHLKNETGNERKRREQRGAPRARRSFPLTQK